MDGQSDTTIHARLTPEQYQHYLNADYSGGIRGLSCRLEDSLIPRLGSEAARLYAKGYRKLWWAFLLTVLGAVLVVIGGLSSISPIWQAGMGVWFVTLVVCVAGWHEMRSSRRIASRVLGVKLRMSEPPPQRDKYIAWCDQKGLTPFSAAGP